MPGHASILDAEMNNRVWRLLILAVVRSDLLMAGTDVAAEAGRGLSSGFLILLAVAVLVGAIVISSAFAWFLKGSSQSTVKTTEKTLRPFEAEPEEALFQWLCEEASSQTGTDIENDKLAMQRLREAFAKATKELENAETAEINLPFIAVKSSGPCHFRKTLNRTDLQRFQT